MSAEDKWMEAYQNWPESDQNTNNDIYTEPLSQNVPEKTKEEGLKELLDRLEGELRGIGGFFFRKRKIVKRFEGLIQFEYFHLEKIREGLNLLHINNYPLLVSAIQTTKSISGDCPLCMIGTINEGRIEQRKEYCEGQWIDCGGFTGAASNKDYSYQMDGQWVTRNVLVKVCSVGCGYKDEKYVP